MISQPDISFIVSIDDESLQFNAVYLDTVVDHFKQTGLSHEFVLTACSLNKDSRLRLEQYRKDCPHFTIIELGQQRREGYRVKRGGLESSGKTFVVLDIKEHISPEQIQDVYSNFIDNTSGVLFGSRKKDIDGASARPAKTDIRARFFSFLIRKYISGHVAEPPLGLWMLKREAAELLFPRMYLEDVGFDFEMMYLARKMALPVSSAPFFSEQAYRVNFKFLFKVCLRIFQIINWHCIPVNTQESNMSSEEFKSMYELENHHWWFLSLRGLIVDLVKSAGLSSPEILDVGSGTGGNMVALNKVGKTHGVEISEDAIALCKERGLENIVMSPAEAIKYSDGQFDVVTCINVLEHVYDPVKVLKEIRRVLHKDGKAVIVVPAFRILWSQHDEALCHFRKFERTSFLQDIEEAGLKTEQVGYFFLVSFFALAPLRIINRLFGSNKKLETDTERLPPNFLNRLLIFVFRLEARLTKKIKLPFGSSLYAVLSK